MLRSAAIVPGTEPIWEAILVGTPVDVSAMQLQSQIGASLSLADVEVAVYGGSYAQQLFDFEGRVEGRYVNGDAPSLDTIAGAIEPVPEGVIFILPHFDDLAFTALDPTTTSTTTTEAPTVTTTTIAESGAPDGQVVEQEETALDIALQGLIAATADTRCVLFVNLNGETPNSTDFPSLLKIAADLKALTNDNFSTVTWAATDESFVNGDRTQLSEAGLQTLNTAMRSAAGSRCPRAAPVEPGTSEDSENPELERRRAYAQRVMQAAGGLAGGGDIVGALISDGFPPALAQAVANTPALVLQHRPNCTIDHALLAAVTWKESRALWDQIGPDGISNPFIYGVPLDGSPFGDHNLLTIRNNWPIEKQQFWGLVGEEFDRALGAFQFIPSSWEIYARDANGDGLLQPQDVADAALAAAIHLCQSGNDLQGGPGSLTQALLGYNRDVNYGISVLQQRDHYLALFASFSTAEFPTQGVGIEQTVNIDGIQIHVSMADQLQRMMNHAASEGINFQGWGWRSNQRQRELRVENGCVPHINHPGMMTVRPSDCGTPTAIPGRSRHERGTAIDFHVGGSSIKSRSHPHFLWLAENAATYGFFNLPSEPWHWSSDGS